eukprot:TRINITY_DN20584_c0_g1_i1.p2 TRINITY_DN20584_c0_g1~~TRINITY_DN20584_c0_g1_i1.p2  ORF type:complete len:127 (+),score=3.62 TRINITY_DN20584_c0_g1_i1:72-452(+)
MASLTTTAALVRSVPIGPLAFKANATNSQSVRPFLRSRAVESSRAIRTRHVPVRAAADGSSDAKPAAESEAAAAAAVTPSGPAATPTATTPSGPPVLTIMAGVVVLAVVLFGIFSVVSAIISLFVK